MKVHKNGKMGDREIVEFPENVPHQVEKLEFFSVHLDETEGGMFCYIVWYFSPLC